MQKKVSDGQEKLSIAAVKQIMCVSEQTQLGKRKTVKGGIWHQKRVVEVDGHKISPAYPPEIAASGEKTSPM